MQWSSIYSDIETLSQVTGQRAFIKRAGQRALDKIAGFHPWSFYLVEDRTTLYTVDDYTTGTISVTNGSPTVTGSSTVFTSAMVGRKLRVGSDNIYYTIKSFESTTQVTLDQNYQGSTVSGKAYAIYQDIYRLAGDVDKFKLFRQMENMIPMLEVDWTEFDIVYPAPQMYDNPLHAIPIGRLQDTYTTGTLSGTVGTTGLTGSSTAWTSVQGLTRGNRIRIGASVYTIKSVDSATGITLYETQDATTSASSYIIYLDNITVQLFPIPNSAAYVYYRYIRKPAPLFNDYDEPDLPPEFNWLIVEGALIEAWTYKGFLDRAEICRKRFEEGIIHMREHYTTDRIYERLPSVTGRLRRPRRLRYPTAFDVAYST